MFLVLPTCDMCNGRCQRVFRLEPGFQVPTKSADDDERLVVCKGRYRFTNSGCTDENKTVQCSKHSTAAINS